MVQRFYPCSSCLNQFLSRELILVEVITRDLSTKNWIVCDACLNQLDELGILVPDRALGVESREGLKTLPKV